MDKEVGRSLSSGRVACQISKAPRRLVESCRGASRHAYIAWEREVAANKGAHWVHHGAQSLVMLNE